MNFSDISNLLSCPPLVVGTIHSEAGLQAARKLPTEALDLLELRVDAFPDTAHGLLGKVSKFRIPLIITVRHPKEGAIFPLTSDERERLYLEFLPVATLIDIELRSAGPLRNVLRAARETGKGVVMSRHDFHTTPDVARLEQSAKEALKAGADIFKVATVTRTPDHVGRLLAFTAGSKGKRVSVMGMGAYGKVSRLLLAQAGSLFNYGYLDKSQVPGQWPARLLKERLAELS